MNKLFLIIGLVVLGVGALFILKPKQVPTSSLTVPLPTVSLQGSVSPTNKEMNSQDIVAKFLQNLAEKRISDAIAMMTKQAVPDDATKQAWGVQFNAFKKLVVKSIEPSMKEEWTENRETYKVTMDVEMSPESANGPIPYYGYENGSNIRWITIEKEGTEWKVAGIGTGP